MSARPTDQQIALALRYLDREFVLGDGDRVDVEMLAEALALGPENCPGLEENDLDDLADLRRARGFAPEFDENTWWHVRARADFHRAYYFNLPAIYGREGACVCSRELLRAVGCRCKYRSV